MKRTLSLISVVLCCVCSRADTNTVDLTQIESRLASIESLLNTIEPQLVNQRGNTLKQFVYNAKDSLQAIETAIYQPSRVSGTFFNRYDEYLSSIDTSMSSVDGKLSTVETYLRLISDDTPNIEWYTEQCYYELRSVNSTLSSCLQYLSDIAYYAQSLPRIEDYQSALSVIVSNINEHILEGINVSIPNTINVDVGNFPNFNPEWDYLSKTFQWSGWNHDNTWQEFSSPNSQDNTLQGASPMPVPATTTLAEYLDKLYVGINNSGRIINDSIIHACYLLEGSNTVSRTEQEEVSDSVSDSVNNADTTMEQISSSIPTPSLSVDTSYISRGISFWDQIGNIQKPPYIVLTTSPSDGDLVSVPEIHIEVKLSDYPALDKALEFARSVFTWLWWVLSVFFLLWLFRRAMVLYSMVMSLLGPQPAQTTAVDVV